MDFHFLVADGLTVWILILRWMSGQQKRMPNWRQQSLNMGTAGPRLLLACLLELTVSAEGIELFRIQLIYMRNIPISWNICFDVPL